MGKEQKSVEFRNFINKLGTSLDSWRESTFINVVMLAYIGISSVNVFCHEMWRDELEAWSVARCSPTVTTLIDNLKYGGHPSLWYIQLYLLNGITENPVVMQFYHLVFAIAVVYVLLKCSPFTRVQKVLLSFGYFLGYEYVAISRCYAQGILLLFCFCAALRKGRFKNYLLLSFILCLLAQTNIYGLIIAVSLGAMLAFEFLTDEEAQLFLRKRKIMVALFFSVFALSAALSIAVIAPDAQSTYAGNWNTGIDFPLLKKTVATVWKSYVPIPTIRYHFWNTNILPGKTLPGTLGLLSLLFALLLFARKPPVLFLFCVGNLGALAVIYMKYYGYIRHHGHLFILLITCLWLSEYYPDKKIRWTFLDRLQGFSVNYKSLFITVILTTQFATGIFASAMDWFCPFSESQNVARFLKDNHLYNIPIVGDKDYAILPISAYLNTNIYDPRAERFESFPIYDKKALVEMSEGNLVKKVDVLVHQWKTDTLLILNYELIINQDYVSKLADFTESIVPDENYYLYLVRYSRPHEKPI